MAVEGWGKEFLGRVAQLTMGQSPDSKYYSEEENGLPFLQGCAEFEARFPKHNIHCSQTKKLACAGSILFSVRAPVGKINIAELFQKNVRTINEHIQNIFDKGELMSEPIGKL